MRSPEMRAPAPMIGVAGTYPARRRAHLKGCSEPGRRSERDVRTGVERVARVSDRPYREDDVMAAQPGGQGAAVAEGGGRALTAVGHGQERGGVEVRAGQGVV